MGISYYTNHTFNWHIVRFFEVAMNEQRKDVAHRILELEHKFAAYKKLHDEELDELRQLLEQLSEDVLALADSEQTQPDSKAVRKRSTDAATS